MERKNTHTKQGKKPKRYPVDSAGVIFSTTKSKAERHQFNFTIHMAEPVDGACLQAALQNTIGRFPIIASRLVRGLFHYSLEPLTVAPEVQQGIAGYLPTLSRKDLRKACFRVSYEGATISVDFFHAVSDGYGAMIFVKSLLAEYVQLRFQTPVPSTHGVLSRTEPPGVTELADWYPVYASGRAVGYTVGNSYKHHGTMLDGQCVTILALPADEVIKRAHAQGVSVTEYLAAISLLAIAEVAQSDPRYKQNPLVLTIPVNLRKLFSPAQTLRNFSLYCNVQLGEDRSLGAVCTDVRRQMAEQNTEENMKGIMQNTLRLLRLARRLFRFLFLKNLAMRIGYHFFGTKSTFMALSNLGNVTLPDELRAHVRSFHCMADTNMHSNHCVVCLSYGDTLYLHFGRSCKETVLEERFEALLREQGLTPEPMDYL